MYPDMSRVKYMIDDINNAADFENNPHIMVWLSDSGYQIDAVDGEDNTIDTLAAGLEYDSMIMVITAFHNYSIL